MGTRRPSKGFSLLEMLAVLAITVIFIGGGLAWAYASSSEARRINELVDLATAVRASAIAQAAGAAAVSADDSAGAYASLGPAWLLLHLDERWLQGSSVRVPLQGVSFSVAGVQSPWGLTPPAALDAARIQMTGVPSSACPAVVTGLIRGFDRVLVNNNIARDVGSVRASNSQILAWCDSAPSLTIEAFFA